jgi:hypothetical protein
MSVGTRSRAASAAIPESSEIALCFLIGDAPPVTLIAHRYSAIATVYRCRLPNGHFGTRLPTTMPSRKSITGIAWSSRRTGESPANPPNEAETDSVGQQYRPHSCRTIGIDRNTIR